MLDRLRLTDAEYEQALRKREQDLIVAAVAEAVLLKLEERSKLFRPKFFARAFTIWGHVIAANAAVYAGLIVVVLLLVGAGTMLSSK